MEEELTPIAGSLLAGAVTILGALIIGRVMSRYINRKLDKMERERFDNLEIPKP